MATHEKLLPVTLSSWPTCDNCLSWSNDDLAVAGGEFVHILTERSSLTRSDTAGHPQWLVLSLRVNYFRQDEWPEQTLATIADLSIGEEQSSCHVVALCWSNAGLGMHRRSVLGVLTSNLVLSLWETGGSQAKYQRTCVVNHSLARQDVSLEQAIDRRSLRIRSFAWLDPLKTTAAPKWGLHYLVVADDNGSITFWQTSKSDVISLGHWNLDRAFKIELADLDSNDKDIGVLSPLQRTLQEQSPITKLDFSPWTQMEFRDNVTDEEQITDVHQLRLRVERGMLEHSTNIYVTASGDGGRVSFSLAKHLQDHPTLSSHAGKSPLSIQPMMENDKQRASVRPTLSKRYFQDALQPLCDDFNRAFQLCGHYRVRIWGTVISRAGTTAAACVTLHPSDVIEYTIPSTEKSSVVFKSTGKMDPRSPPSSRSTSSIYREILQFAYENSKTYNTITSSFDKKLIRAYVNFAHTVLGPTSQLVISLRDLRDSLQDNGTDASNGQLLQTHGHDQSEDCEICGASVAFTSDTTKASCDNGHQFSRCQLCFVSIQEPGISKYCSQCGKQFLDLAKLRSDSGPSFAQAMFDHFDVCPYCQAKFRG